MQSGKLVIKHHGIEVLRENKVALVSKSSYIDSSDNCLENILDHEMIKRVYQELISDESNDSLIEDLKIVEKDFSRIDTNFELAVKLIEKIRAAESKEDLKEIYNTILLGINIISRQEIGKVYKKYPDLVLSIMAKSIVNGYVKSKLRRSVPSKIRNLEVRKASNNESIEEIMGDALNIDFTEKASNGIDTLITNSFSDQLDEAYLRIGSQCFDCTNGYVGRCEKISDYPTKKDITDYPFITDGFQWYINDNLDEFIVIRCNDFKKAPKVSMTPEQVKKVKGAKLLMRLLYWDVGTQQEAEEIEENNKAFGYH